MPKRKKRKKKHRIKGAETPDEQRFPGIPPQDNLARCAECKRMTDACLVEVSRRHPSAGMSMVVLRVYACPKHATRLAKKLVRELTGMTNWKDKDESDGEEAAEVLLGERPTLEAESSGGDGS